MAEFQKVAKARKRMCDSYETCSNGCPVGKMLNGIICSSWMLEHPVLAETAIMKWDAEHPIMTNRMRFSEVFGFDLDMLYSVSEATIKWLDAEYKGGQDETE